MSTTTYIPDASEVQTRGNSNNWRIANGTICKGRELDGSLESTDKLVGYVIRVGVHNGVTDDGEAYRKVECDLRTKNGIEHIGCSTKSLSSSISFALGLLQIGPNDLVAITAGQSKKLNKFGKYTTYANWFKVDPATLRSTEIKHERSDENMESRLERILAELQNHPLYAARPQREEDGPTHKSEFLKEIDGKGWPNFMDFPGPWLEMISAALGKKFKSLDEVDDDDWGSVRHALLEKTETPKKLVGLVKPSQAKEPDPFE